MPKGFKYGPRFASPVNSPSYEWRDDTQFLQVTRGCSHNGCRYCTFFKNVPYGKVDLDEVEFYLRFIANGDTLTFSGTFSGHNGDSITLPSAQDMRSTPRGPR